MQLTNILKGFLGGLVVKNLIVNQKTQETEVGSLGWEDTLEEEMATHGNSMDRGAWWATVHGIAKESDTTQRLKNNIFFPIL